MVMPWRPITEPTALLGTATWITVCRDVISTFLEPYSSSATQE